MINSVHAIILCHFLVHGFSSERIYMAYSDITSYYAFVDLPIFDRSPSFISRYLLTVHILIELFSQLCNK